MEHYAHLISSAHDVFAYIYRMIEMSQNPVFKTCSIYQDKGTLILEKHNVTLGVGYAHHTRQ